MTNEYFESIKSGLEEAVAVAQGDDTRARTTQVPALNIKALRKELNVTQEQFARLIGSTLQTVASWERQKDARCPTGPVQKFLLLLQHKPELAEDLAAV